MTEESLRKSTLCIAVRPQQLTKHITNCKQMTIIKKKLYSKFIAVKSLPYMYTHAHMQTHFPLQRRMYIMDTQNVHIVFFLSLLTPIVATGPMIQTRLTHFKTYVHSHTYTCTHSSHTLDSTSGTGRRGGPEKNGRSPCESSARRSTAWQRIAASHISTTLWLAGQEPGLERSLIDRMIQQR